MIGSKIYIKFLDRKYGRSKDYFFRLVCQVIGWDLRLSTIYRLYAFSFIERFAFTYLSPPLRCLFTYRKGGIIKKFRMSRLKFSEFMGLGLLPGLRTSSW